MNTSIDRQSLTLENCQDDSDFMYFLKVVEQDLWLRDAPFDVQEEWVTESILDTYKENGSEMDAIKNAEDGFDPTPQFAGEPPITQAEIHHAAWKQHQEMHS